MRCISGPIPEFWSSIHLSFLCLMTPQLDPLTGEEFLPKRRNQRFASRQNQVRYNNQVAQQKRDAKRPLDQALDRNRSILLRLLGSAQSVTHSHDFLRGAGYNLEAFTQTKRQANVILYCVYEFGVQLLPTNQFKITRL